MSAGLCIVPVWLLHEADNPKRNWLQVSDLLLQRLFVFLMMLCKFTCFVSGTKKQYKIISYCKIKQQKPSGNSHLP